MAGVSTLSTASPRIGERSKIRTERPSGSIWRLTSVPALRLPWTAVWRTVGIPPTRSRAVTIVRRSVGRSVPGSAFFPQGDSGVETWARAASVRQSVHCQERRVVAERFSPDMTPEQVATEFFCRFGPHVVEQPLEAHIYRLLPALDQAVCVKDG